MKIERRSLLDKVESAGGNRTIKGTAVRFNVDNLVWEDSYGKYYEMVKAGAFDSCDLSDVVLRYNHDDSVPVLARTTNGTLRLHVDDTALTIEADLADTSVGNDIFKLVEQGLVAGLSMGFIVEDDYYENNRRTIYRIGKLFEISIVDQPAYSNTDVEVLQRNFKKCLQEQQDKKRKHLILRTRL